MPSRRTLLALARALTPIRQTVKEWRAPLPPLPDRGHARTDAEWLSRLLWHALDDLEGAQGAIRSGADHAPRGQTPPSRKEVLAFTRLLTPMVRTVTEWRALLPDAAGDLATAGKLISDAQASLRRAADSAPRQGGGA